MTFYLVLVNVSLTAKFFPLFEGVYLVETLICLGILSATPLAVYTVMGMALVHRNLRLTLASVVVHFSYAIIARLVLIYYQFFRLPSDDDDMLYVFANLVRESFYGFIMAMPCVLAVERCFATLFSSWYEKQSASTLIIFIMQSLSAEIYAWGNALFLIYEVYSFQFNVLSYGAVFIGGSLFQYVLAKNVQYNRRLQKMKGSEYCLSRSYQIRENIKIMQMLRKLAFPTLIFNIPAFAFVSLYAFLPNEERMDVVRNVSAAFFDLWIALYAVSFGLLTYNVEPRLQESIRRFYPAAYVLDRYDQVTGRIRKLTMRATPPPQRSESDIYFSMLSADLHSEKDRNSRCIASLYYRMMVFLSRNELFVFNTVLVATVIVCASLLMLIIVVVYCCQVAKREREQQVRMDTVDCSRAVTVQTVEAREATHQNCAEAKNPFEDVNDVASPHVRFASAVDVVDDRTAENKERRDDSRSDNAVKNPVIVPAKPRPLWMPQTLQVPETRIATANKPIIDKAEESIGSCSPLDESPPSQEENEDMVYQRALSPEKETVNDAKLKNNYAQTKIRTAGKKKNPFVGDRTTNPFEE